jgi:hypothetical protein
MCSKLIEFSSGHGFSRTNVKSFIVRRKEATQEIREKLLKILDINMLSKDWEKEEVV